MLHGVHGVASVHSMHDRKRPQAANIPTIGAPAQSLRVRRAQWVRHMISAGYPTYEEQARRLGVARTTVGRVVSGQTTPSPGIIAGALIATGRTFEELFEVTELAPAPAPRRRRVAA